MNVNILHKVYFLGIGGIGMSALARYFLEHGVQVSGYDKTPSEITEALEQEGAQIHFSEEPNLVPQDAELVVYTPAIPANHNEWEAVKGLGVPVLKRAQVLGLISNVQQTLAVAGTHGKTTTSSMFSHVVNTVAGSVNAFIGGVMTNYGTNHLFNENAPFTVVEADEYDRSFLHLKPKGAIITSTDADHLDIYGSSNEMISGFQAFANLVEQVVVAHEDVHVKPEQAKSISYGKQESNDYQLTNIHVDNGFQCGTVISSSKKVELRIQLPGDHNLLNATAAYALSVEMGLDANQVIEALASFKGVKRRFEVVYQNNDVIYVDDYAHHPTELKAAIQAARQFYPGKKITGIFQPHLFSRTRDFEPEFAKVLSTLDQLLLMEIYPARELPIDGITSTALLEKTTLEHKQLVQKEELLEAVKTAHPEVLMTLGAGDIDRFVKPLKELLSA